MTYIIAYIAIAFICVVYTFYEMAKEMDSLITNVNADAPHRTT